MQGWQRMRDGSAGKSRGRRCSWGEQDNPDNRGEGRDGVLGMSSEVRGQTCDSIHSLETLHRMQSCCDTTNYKRWRLVQFNAIQTSHRMT